VTDDALGDAADQHVREARAAVRAEHDHVGADLDRVLTDGVGGALMLQRGKLDLARDLAHSLLRDALELGVHGRFELGHLVLRIDE
jgi:hypothetical protein